MFLLNNIYDRPYREIYPSIQNVVFDISDRQLENSRNADWQDITSGNVVCVVSSTRKMSTFYVVDASFKTDLLDPVQGAQHVITGKVIAKLQPELDMTSVLNKYSVNHPLLPGNKFSIGFNVANLRDALSALTLRTGKGVLTLGQIESGA